MAEPNQGSTGLVALVGSVARTALSAIQNRLELLLVEWQEERAHLSELLFWLVSLLLLALMTVLLVTATVIFLFPENRRIYVTGGFALVYLFGAIGAGIRMKSLLGREPFSGTIDQAKKDRAWLESLK